MRAKKVTRYYCDFCKTSKGTKPAMTKHEERCTNNPNRVCGMCLLDPDHEQKPMNELIEAYDCTYDFPALDVAADGCPACILSAMRQTAHEYRENQFPKEENFNYKERMKKRYSEIMKRRYEEGFDANFLRHQYGLI